MPTVAHVLASVHTHAHTKKKLKQKECLPEPSSLMCGCFQNGRRPIWRLVLYSRRLKDPWVLLSVLILNVFIREGTSAPRCTFGSQRNNFPKSVSPLSGSQGSNSGRRTRRQDPLLIERSHRPGVSCSLDSGHGRLAGAEGGREGMREGGYLVLVNEHQVALLQL